jgi:cobalt-zinc-cadmium efflux system membrane fusion protein
MPSDLSRAKSRMTLAISAVSTLLLGLSQPACQQIRKVEGASPQAAARSATDGGQAGLFTVSAEQESHLKVVPVERASWFTTIHTTGTVDWDADRTTQAITQVNGPISRILVDLGSKVKAGDPLLFVSSPDVTNAISTYRKARNREALAKRIVDRNQELLARGAIAGKDLESSQADFNDANTDVENSLQALRIFGITASEIEKADTQGVAISPELAVRSPIEGVVVQKLVSPGQLIQAGTTACFAISDVSTVWVQGHIFDRDLPQVRPGNSVEESNPAFTRSFRGEVGYVGASVDPATRTTPVRIVTHNPGGLLKKDMFVDAAIRTGTRSNLLVVPVSALLHDEQNEPMVYVEAAPGKFAKRLVQLGEQRDSMVEIRGGLQPGERVVSEGGLFVQFALTAQ